MPGFGRNKEPRSEDVRSRLGVWNFYLRGGGTVLGCEVAGAGGSVPQLVEFAPCPVEVDGVADAGVFDCDEPGGLDVLALLERLPEELVPGVVWLIVPGVVPDEVVVGVDAHGAVLAWPGIVEFVPVPVVT